MTDLETRERSIRNEERISALEKDVTEIKGDIRTIRDDIYAIRQNELPHIKKSIPGGRNYWLKILGAGGLGAIITKLIENLPAILDAIGRLLGL